MIKTDERFHTPRVRSRPARLSPFCRQLWSAGRGPTSPAKRVRRTRVRRSSRTADMDGV